MGAASEHGATVARTLAREYRLLAADVQPLVELVGAIRKEGGVAESLVGDPSDPRDAERLASAAENLGLPRVYVHMRRPHPDPEVDWLETPGEAWDRTMAESVRSVWLGCRAFSPQLRRHSPSQIIVVGSDAAATGMAPLEEATAMAALTGVVRTMAREMGDDNVAVNMLCLPYADSSDGLLAETSRQSPVADAVKFLCSSDADFITGQSWLLNDGRWLQ